MKIWQILLLPLLLLPLVSRVTSVVYAQGAAGITVIPPKFELFANPGDVVTETIRVRNNSDVPQTFGVLVEDFSSTGEEGKVVLEEGEESTAYSLKSWIDLSSQNIVIQPNEEVSFPFSIVVPRDADPGGHYASVLFQLGSGEQIPGAASVQHRVGSLVLLRVSGNVVEESEIETFLAPVYSQQGPVNFELRVKNNGTTHIRPNGTIVITNMFGQKVDEIPLNSANVFPGAVRKMDTEWNKDALLGHYTATLVATYGQQNLPLTAATKFTVASPVALILIGVGTLAAAVFIISLITGRNRLLKALKVLTTGK